MEAEVEEEAIPKAGPGGRHLKKRALKNKGLAVGFNEKDLRDYVTGFHKRKKKRRKEAKRKQEEAQRRKRIEERKKRKLEKELSLYGGVVPATDSEPGDKDDNQDYMDQEDKEQAEPVAGMKTYENEDLKVTVITSKIGCEEESYPVEKKEAAVSQHVGADKRPNIPVKKKKPFKKSAKPRSHPKLRSKRDKRQGKKLSKK